MPDTNELLKRWSLLPDEAVVHAKVAAAVTGLSERTIRYDSRFPRVYLTENRYGIRVGDIRKVLAGENWRKLGDAAQHVAESYSADIRDHNIKMQCELNRRKGR